MSDLGNIAIPELIDILENEDARLLAVRSLCCIRQPETIAPLLSVIQDPQAAIRAAAIEADRNIQPQRLLTLKVRSSKSNTYRVHPRLMPKSSNPISHKP